MLELKRNYQGLSYLSMSTKGELYPEITDLSGESSFLNPPDDLVSRLRNYQPNSHGRFATEGYKPLRDYVSHYIQQNYSHSYNPDTEITISAGYHQAFYAIISSLIREGDEVILFEPSYCSYLPAIEANGGRAVFLPLKQPDFHISWEEVQKAINTRTRLIIINSPHQVTGQILNASDLDRLSRIVNGTKISILSDETYAPLIYEGYEHQSVARFPKLVERTFIVAGFSKILHMDSWNLCFCMAPEKMMTQFRKSQLTQIFTANLPCQVALSDYLSAGQDILRMVSNFQHKRDLLIRNLKQSNLIFQPSPASYFQVFNYSRISNRKDVDFCKWALDQFKINLTPLSYFYHEQTDLRYFRVSFATEDEHLLHANQIFQNLT